MSITPLWSRVLALSVVGLVSFGLQFSPVSAQDRLAKMPGVDQFRKMQPLLGGTMVSGAITPAWTDDSWAFTYNFAGSRYRFDVMTMAAVIEEGGAGGRGRRKRQARRWASRR